MSRYIEEHSPPPSAVVLGVFVILATDTKLQTYLLAYLHPSPWRTNLVTFIVKNLLSKDAIVSFVTDTELYFT